LVKKFGYERVTVEGPETELRVIGGVRRRVTVAYVNNRGGRRIDPQHIAVIQSFVEDRAPIGALFLLELR
jgi:hypothetical protein